LAEALRRSLEEVSGGVGGPSNWAGGVEEEWARPGTEERARPGSEASVVEPPTEVPGSSVPAAERSPASTGRRPDNPRERARRAAADRLWQNALARKAQENLEASRRAAGDAPASPSPPDAQACALLQRRRPTMWDRGPAVIHTLPPASSRRSA